ncbi:MAG: DMT family transporter [Alphaproteobacteria bacterium]
MTEMVQTGGAIPTRRMAVACMILSAACWGLATVMSKAALSAFSPPSLVAIQLSASVAFLWGAVAATGQGCPLNRQTATAAATGVLEPGLAYVFGTFGLLLTSAGNASLISTTEPLLILLLSWLVFRQSVSGRTLLAIVIAMAGVTLVSGAHADAAGGGIEGDALIVLATLFAALYVLASSRVASRLPSVTLAALQQTVGLALALAVVAVVASPSVLLREIASADWPMLCLALISGIVQYALAFWFYLICLRRLSPGTAGLFLTLVPVFGLLGAAVFLGEVMSLPQLLGAVMILSALVWIRVR